MVAINDMNPLDAAYREPPTLDGFQIAEGLPCIVWIAGPDGKIEWCNQKFYDFTGLTLQAVAGWGWMPRVHPDDLSALTRDWANCLATGSSLDAIARLRGAEGDYRWHSARAGPRRGAKGVITRWFGTLTDIHDRQMVVEESTHVVDALMQGYHAKKFPVADGLSFDTLYRPANIREKLGGDWYDIFGLPDGRIGFSLGDVCGHGVDAAVKMGEAKQAIFVAACLGDPAPQKVLQQANRVIFLNNHHVSITTALYGVVDTTRRTITYAAAGHHPPILALADGTTKVLPNHGFPLGVEEHIPPLIKTHQFEYEAGSLLVLYTDGLIEFNHDIFAGEARLLAAASEVVKRVPASPAKFIADSVLGAVQPSDDVAVLTVRFEN